MSFQVKLDVFEGPLDLLLYLVSKEQLDITAISLARVADEYFAYLKMLQITAVEAKRMSPDDGVEKSGLDLDAESNWLVVFACLLEMKSRLLLPIEPSDDVDDGFDLERDTEEHDLVERLKEYKRYKEASFALQDRERESLQMFGRPVLDEEEAEAAMPALDVSLPDLLDALKSLLENNQRRKKAPRKLRLHRVALSVPQRMKEILSWLAATGDVGRRVEFFELFEEEADRPQIIVTFLAILELARLRRIRVSQDAYSADAQSVGRRPIVVELVDATPPTEDIDSGGGKNAAPKTTQTDLGAQIS